MNDARAHLPRAAKVIEMTRFEVALRCGTASSTGGGLGEIVLAGQAGAVVALPDDQRFVLVGQYRPGPALVLLELPGAGVDVSEYPVAAAARELREKTGYEAAELTLVERTWLTGRDSAQGYGVLTTGCPPCRQGHP